MKEMNTMYLRRRNKMIVSFNDEDSEKVSEQIIATSLVNLESYGYTFSEKLIEELKLLSIEQYIDFYNMAVSIIKELVGVDKITEPMYPNFPQQVMEMDEVELYLNAIIHYATDGQLVPEYEKKERFPLIGNYDLTVIDLGNVEDFNTIFTNLVSSKVSISASDKSDISWFLKKFNKEYLKKIMPEEIPFKEILSYVTSELWFGEYDDDIKEILIPYYKTATDVLRLATVLSDGDESLSKDYYYNSFKRKDRRILLTMLENANNIEEDMLRYKNRWIRLGEVLHPGEYKKFKKVNRAFDKIRNDKKIDTFNSNIEKAFKEKDLDKVLELLTSRPGEFARRLDRTLRLATDKNESNKIVLAFSQIAEKIPTPLLLQIRSYFIRRKGNNNLRVFSIKGSGKLYGKENDLKELDETTCTRIENICNLRLMNEYSKRDYLGKVYIDEELKDYIAPTSQRNSSKALKSMAKGSKMKIKDRTNFLRNFVYWKQKNGCRTDLDLSALCFTNELEVIDEIWYGNLRGHKTNICHSGDFISARDGASEFIDIDIKKCKENGVRYILVSINSFSEEYFSELEDCFIGYMELDNNTTGEVFEPKAIANKSDLSSDCEQVIANIIDLEEMCIYWADMPVSKSYGYNNIKFNKKNLTYTLESIMNICKPNLYDVIFMNGIARGEVVDNKEEAEIVYSTDGDITPFDVDIIVGEYI